MLPNLSNLHSFHSARSYLTSIGVGLVAALVLNPQSSLATEITVNWSQPTGITTTKLSFGLNAFYASNPEVAGISGSATYKANMSYMAPGIVRYHNNQLIGEARDNKLGWVIDAATPNYRFDRNRIFQALQTSFPHQPVRMMTVSDWPEFMRDPASRKLRVDQYDRFGLFCADLVRAINVEQKRQVTYWEVLNELDVVYKDDMAELARIYMIAARAMKAVDPSIKVGGPSFLNPYDAARVNAFLAVAHPEVDFVSYHAYATGRSDQNVQSLWNFAANSGLATRLVKAAWGKYSDRRVEFFYNEFNMDFNGFDDRMTDEVGAIYDAIAMISNSNSGATGSMAWNEADGRYGKMGNRFSNWKKRPAAYVHHLLNTHARGQVLTSSSSALSDVVPFAIKTSQGRSLMLINRSGIDQVATSQFTGWAPSHGARQWTSYQVSGVGLVTTGVRSIEVSSGVTLPKDSVTVLTYTDDINGLN